jgi:hypothetical protein
MADKTNENLTVHFKVKDYAAWRTSYDKREKSRVSAGITNARVFRSAEDPNDVVILQEVADAAKARTWFGKIDTFFVRPRKDRDVSTFANDKMSFPDGRTVQALSREVFEEAVRAATLKK